MIDKQYHKDKAMEFCGANSCYIHTEMKDGKYPETVLCGDFHALMWGVVAEVSRMSEKMGADWYTTLGMINALHNFGYDEITKGLDKSNMPTYEGTDYQEEMVKQIRLEETKRANIEVANLKVDVAKLEKENRNLTDRLALVKKESSKREETLRKEKLQISKECKELESRLREMEEACRKGAMT